MKKKIIGILVVALLVIFIFSGISYGATKSRDNDVNLGNIDYNFDLLERENKYTIHAVDTEENTRSDTSTVNNLEYNGKWHWIHNGASHDPSEAHYTYDLPSAGTLGVACVLDLSAEIGNVISKVAFCEAYSEIDTAGLIGRARIYTGNYSAPSGAPLADITFTTYGVLGYHDIGVPDVTITYPGLYWVVIEIDQTAGGQSVISFDNGPMVTGGGYIEENNGGWIPLHYEDINVLFEVFVGEDIIVIEELTRTIAIKGLKIPLLKQEEIQIVIRGPTTIERKKDWTENPPDRRKKIDTEIISMDLTGHILGMPIQISESPEKKSTGIIRQKNPDGDLFPADSFFDVYVEIYTPLPSPYDVIYNKEPVIMSNVIWEIPPYFRNYTANNTPVPLYTKRGIFSTTPIGHIVDAEHLLPPKPSELEVEITRPKEGYLYFNDREIIPLPWTVIVGSITIKAESDTTLDKLGFFIDVNLKNIDNSPPYNWTWDENPDYLQHLIRVAAYDNQGNMASDEIVVWKFF